MTGQGRLDGNLRRFLVTDGSTDADTNVPNDEDGLVNAAVETRLSYHMIHDLAHAPGGEGVHHRRELLGVTVAAQVVGAHRVQCNEQEIMADLFRESAPR